MISYSAYLWHQPLFAFARLLDQGGQFGKGTMLSLAALTLLLGWISWRYVEQPFRRKEAFTRSRIFSLSGLSALAVTSFAALIIVTKGFPDRYPADQQAWVAIGPNEYAHYVRDGHRSTLDRPLANDRRNMVLVGDSFSQDFYNVVEEAGGFADYSISSIYVPARCQIHFGLDQAEVLQKIDPADQGLCKMRALSETQVEKMRSADVVVLAARWQPWAAKAIDRTLAALDISGQVIVVGSKSFEPQRRALLSFDPSDISLARKAPTDRVLETSSLLKKLTQEGSFVDLVPLMCASGCPLFTESGEIISYDGLHLTQAGAQFVAEHVFNHPALSQFSKRN